MNRVIISWEGIGKPAWTAGAAAFCKKVLRKLALDNWELSVVFCNNDFIRGLNKRFRHKDEPTDILSFSQMEGAGDFSHPGDGYSIIGDMIISLDMLGETSKEFSVPQEEELKRLLIHGVLHLSGRDHKGGDSRQPMLMQQEDICRELAEEKIF